MDQQPSKPDENAGHSRDLGLLLVGHGTRDEAGLAEFRELHRLLVLQAGDLPVEACFLELAEPTIVGGIEGLLARGVRQIVVAPLLLFAAGHAKRDIPEGVADALAQLARTSSAAKTAQIVSQLPPLGCHEKLLELAELRYREAKPLPGQGSDEEQNMSPETLILVGRGSSDLAARAEMFRLAELRAAQLPGLAVEVCFYALSEPKLEPTLERVAKSGAGRVMVQPHLLFSGEVRRGIEQLAEKYAAAAPPQQQWLLCEPLGPHRLLVQALWELFKQHKGPVSV